MMNINLIIFTLALSFTVYSQLFPHIIWQYWNYGQQNLGSFQKMCFQRVKQLHKQTDWEIRFVSQKTIKNFLNSTNFQKFQKGLNKNFKFPQAKADLLRYYLLKQHGGVWMDITILLKQNLNWLDNLQNNPRVIHKNIFKNPQVFLYIQHQTYRKTIGQVGKQEQMIKIDINGYDYYPLFYIQNAFIAAVKESRYLTDLIAQYQNLLLHGQSLYNQERQKLKIPYTHSDYFMSFRASSINQYRKYIEYQQAKRAHKQIASLENHFYNIVFINKIAGMYHGTRFPQRVQYYMLHEEGPFGDYQYPLMKFSALPKKFVNSILMNQQKINQYRYRQFSMQLYEFGKKFVKKNYNCLYQLSIHEDSAINKYLLSNKQLAKKQYPLAEIIKSSQLPLVCRIGKLSTYQKLYPQIQFWGVLAISLFVIIEIAFQYYFYFFKISKATFIYLKNVQSTIYIKFVLLVALYLQKDLIYSQYQLWKQQSPTAFLTGVIQLFFTIIIFSWLLEVDTRNLKKNKYLLRLLILQIIQYSIQLHYAVWKYQGQIYNYQDLNHINTLKLKQSQIQLDNIIFVIFFINIFYYSKKLFKLFESQQQKAEINFKIEETQRQENQNSFNNSETSLVQHFEDQVD